MQGGAKLLLRRWGAIGNDAADNRKTCKNNRKTHEYHERGTGGNSRKAKDAVCAAKRGRISAKLRGAGGDAAAEYLSAHIITSTIGNCLVL